MTSPVATALQWLLSSPASLAVTTPAGVVEAATPAFAEALGVDAASVVGATLASWIAPDERAGFVAAVQTAANGDANAAPDAVPAPLRAGGRSPSGQPFRCAFTFSSVPASGSAVLSAARLNPIMVPAGGDHIEPHDTFTNELSGAMSHDIRASLRSVNGFLGLVERSTAVQSDESALKHLRTSRDAGAAADHGVEALVRLVRIRERALAVRTVSLAAVIDKGIQHSLEVLPGPVPTIDQPGASIQVLGDPLLVGEIMGELFTNSRKFAGEMVKIVVGCTEQEGWLSITVSDNGPGVSPDLAEDAFRMFRLLQPKGKFPGVGMGLPLARVIAESHGGTLHLEARAEPGAVAHLRLPSGGARG